MRKIRFAIIGSGFRALEYVRVTKALSDHFELCALLTRTEEKRDLLCKQYGIHTTCSIDEVLSLSPDFVVVAVDKAHIAEVSMEWSNRGIPVLCETPIAMDIGSLCKIHDLHLKGRKIIVAEQYHLFPENIARMKLVDMDLIGEPYYLNISLAHEYHCTSLIRRFLKLDTDTAFSAEAKDFFFPGKQIMTRYERFTDGRIADMKRTLALFTFENNKVALYDFDSDQYRSPIRNDHYKLQGVNGEILNDTVVYIDENADPCKKSLDFTSRIVRTDSDNPNYSRFTVREDHL